MGGNTGLAGPAVSASKMLQGRLCLWNTFEVESFLEFESLKWSPGVDQPAAACWPRLVFWTRRWRWRLRGVRAAEVTAQTFAGCIAGNFGHGILRF